MDFFQSEIDGDANIGLYAVATDKFILSGKQLDWPVDIPVEIVRPLDTPYAGVFYAANSSMIFAHPEIADDRLVKFGKIIKIDSSYNAIGNLVVVNDNACLISPLIRRWRNHIEDFGIDCEARAVGGINLIGAVARATNKGIAVHPSVNDEELDFLEDFFKVKAGISTISGLPFVGSGLVGNSSFMAISSHATGIEMARVGEIFE